MLENIYRGNIRFVEGGKYTGNLKYEDKGWKISTVTIQKL